MPSVEKVQHTDVDGTCVTFHSKTAETKVVVALKVHFESRAITQNGAKKKIKVPFWNVIIYRMYIASKEFWCMSWLNDPISNSSYKNIVEFKSPILDVYGVSLQSGHHWKVCRLEF